MYCAKLFLGWIGCPDSKLYSVWWSQPLGCFAVWVHALSFPVCVAGLAVIGDWNCVLLPWSVFMRMCGWPRLTVLCCRSLAWVNKCPDSEIDWPMRVCHLLPHRTVTGHELWSPPSPVRSVSFNTILTPSYGLGDMANGRVNARWGRNLMRPSFNIVQFMYIFCVMKMIYFLQGSCHTLAFLFCVLGRK